MKILLVALLLFTGCANSWDVAKHRHESDSRFRILFEKQEQHNKALNQIEMDILILQRGCQLQFPEDEDKNMERTSGIKELILTALLPSQITKILEESFIESKFSTIADFNADQLARIKELVEAVSEE